MSKVGTSVSACRHCRFYQLEGRRGGECQRLNAPVQATWSACSLAIPSFLEDWKPCLANPLVPVEPVFEPIAVAYEISAFNFSESRSSLAVAVPEK